MPHTTPGPGPRPVPRAVPSVAGWLTFTGILILMVGVFHVVNGLAALVKDDYYLVTSEGLMVFNYTAWGWIWLLLGLAQAAVGIGIFDGQDWARLSGVMLAVVVSVGHVAFMAAFPLWSVTVIGLSVLVIYALCVPPAENDVVA